MPSQFLVAATSCLILLVAVHGMGSGLYNLFRLPEADVAVPQAPLLRTFFVLTLGLAGCIGVLAVLAAMHFFVQWAVVSLLSLAATVGYTVAWRARKLVAGKTPSCALDGQCLADALVLVAVGALLLIRSSHAPGHWDDTSYHLPLARLFVQQQGLAVSEYLRFPLFPANMQLVMAMGLMLSGEVLAQMLATLPVFITFVGLMGCSQWLFRASTQGTIAGALYLGTPMLGMVFGAAYTSQGWQLGWSVEDVLSLGDRLKHSNLGYAYVDHGLTLFCTAALLAVGVCCRQPQLRGGPWLAIAGVFAGVAGGTKLLGLVFAAILGFVFLVATRKWRLFWLYTAVCALAAGGWYLRSYWVSGDPVHPAGAKIFGYYLWDAGDLASQQAEQARHGVEKHWQNFLVAFGHARAFVVWPALAAVIFIPRSHRTLRLFWAVFALYCVFWFYVSQVDRYLLPILPLACLLTAVVLQRAATGATQLGLRLPSNRTASWLMGTALFGLFITQAQRWANGPTFQQQLDAQPAYVLAQRANDVAPLYGSQLLDIGFENARFFYHGKFVGDWFGKVRFREFAMYAGPGWHMRAPEDVATRMQDLGVNLLLVDQGQFAFDPVQYAQYFELLQTAGRGYLYVRKSHTFP